MQLPADLQNLVEVAFSAPLNAEDLELVERLAKEVAADFTGLSESQVLKSLKLTLLIVQRVNKIKEGNG